MENLATILFNGVGLFGAFVYLGSYALLQLGLISGQSYLYSALNITAASLVLISLGESFNLSSAIIQVSWILISLVGITRVLILTKRARFTDEEQLLLDNKFPELPRHLARQFLNRGIWVEGEPGTVLSTEGEEVEALIYFSDGEASVEISGRRIGQMPLNSFIGELTILTNEKATATVTVTKVARYFYLSAPDLKQMCLRSEAIQSAIASSFAVDSKEKLVTRNKEYLATTGSSE